MGQQPYGHRVRQLRKQLGLSQPQLADKLASRVTWEQTPASIQSLVSRWERGAAGAEAYDRFLRLLWTLAQLGAVDFGWLAVGVSTSDASSHPNRDAAVAYARACGLAESAIDAALSRDIPDVPARDWLRMIERDHERLLEDP